MHWKTKGIVAVIFCCFQIFFLMPVAEVLDMHEKPSIVLDSGTPLELRKGIRLCNTTRASYRLFKMIVQSKNVNPHVIKVFLAPSPY